MIVFGRKSRIFCVFFVCKRHKKCELEVQKRQSACPLECRWRERRERCPGVIKGHGCVSTALQRSDIST